jgi:phasin family protein
MPKYIDAANASIQTFESLAGIAFNTSEQLLALNLEAARSLCEFASANAQPIMGEDMREQFANRLNANGQGVEQVTAYLRNLNELCLKMQAEMAEVNAQRLTELSDSLVSAFDALAKTAPAGSADFVAAMKSTLNSANMAYEKLIKAGREVTETNWSVATKALQLQPIVAAPASTNGKSARKAA